MKANELRAANWVDTGEFHIKEIQGNHQYNLEWYKYVHMFKPIKLTEEWLVKFGFEDLGDLFDCRIYKKGIITVTILNGIFTFSLKRDTKSNYIPLVEFKHVHQLQNLYFSLCGEELIIKE